MRQRAIWQKFKNFGSFCLIMLLLPYVITVFVHGKDFTAAGDKEKLFVNVKKTKETEIIQVPWTEYFVGIMGREVPVDAEMEFLKAQAVLIRTKLYQELDSQGKGGAEDPQNAQNNQGVQENPGNQESQQSDPENQESQQNGPENQESQQNDPGNQESQQNGPENQESQQNDPGNQESQQNGPENQGAQQNAAENQVAQQNAAGSQKIQQNAVGNQKVQQNATENQESQQNATGNQDAQQNTAGNQDVQQNAAGNQKAQQNAAGNQEAQQNTAENNQEAQQNAAENQEAQQNDADNQNIQQNNQENDSLQEGESDLAEPKILDEQYLSMEELEKKAGTSGSESYYSRLFQAMQETENQVLYYQDTYAAVPFHQSSNGMTRSAQEVLGTDACPYLAVRECPLDKEADDEMQVTTFEYKDIQAKCQSFLVAVAEEDANKTYEFSDFEIISLDSAGYVTQMRIGETICTGDQFRDALSLASSAFSLKDGEGKMRITTMGKGHGLGMSQWTAQQMAKSGNSYEEILQFFFEGTTLTDGGEVAEKLE